METYAKNIYVITPNIMIDHVSCPILWPQYW